MRMHIYQPRCSETMFHMQTKWERRKLNWNEERKGRTKGNNSSSSKRSLFDIVFWNPKIHLFARFGAFGVIWFIPCVGSDRIFTNRTHRDQMKVHTTKREKRQMEKRRQWKKHNVPGLLILFFVIFTFYSICDDGFAENSNFNAFHLAIYLWPNEPVLARSFSLSSVVCFCALVRSPKENSNKIIQHISHSHRNGIFLFLFIYIFFGFLHSSSFRLTLLDYSFLLFSTNFTFPFFRKRATPHVHIAFSLVRHKPKWNWVEITYLQRCLLLFLRTQRMEHSWVRLVLMNDSSTQQTEA